MSHLPLAESRGLTESPEALRARVVALEARLAVLEPLLERFPGVIARFDPQLRHCFVSASVERATGLPVERFLGKTNRDLGMPEELVDQWDAALANVFATGQPARIQFAFPAATELQYYDAELVPEPGPDGSVATVIAVTRDVTERVRAEAAAAGAQLEEELRRHQALLQGLFDRAPAIILVKDQAGRYLTANNRLADVVGRPLEDILGKSVHDLFPPAIAAEMAANDQQVFATGEALVAEEELPIDGEPHTQLAMLFPLFDAQGATSAMGLIATDITKQKQLEAALRAQEAVLVDERAFLDAVLEHLDDGVAVSDAQGQLRFTNAALARITGYQRGGAAPQNLVALLGEHHAESSTGSDESGLTVEQPLQNELRTFVHEDGTRRELLVSQQWLLRDGAPLLVSSLRDVTAQRAAEVAQRRLEQKLQEAQRLESLGRLAGGIAHDFNNLLAVILGHADLLSVDLAPDAPGHASLRQIAGAARQGADLARQMLIYAGRGRPMVERVDLNEVIRNDRLLLEASLRTDARLQLTIAPELPPLMVDLDQIRQVVMNLVSNASEALGEGGGLITITMEHTTRWEGDGHDDDLPVGAYVQLTVQDTGEGIHPALLERVFEPFFSTRFIGRGLGLAVVRSIVERHGGRVFANSEPGQGTRVTVLLPTFATEMEELSAMLPPTRRGGMVLVIDDEARAQKVAGSMLERLGYTPVFAEDEVTTLAELQTRGSELALVLLDLTMPGMHGEDVLKAIRAITPDLPVVVMSGYSTREVAQELINQGARGFLEKPLSLSALRARLRALDVGERPR